MKLKNIGEFGLINKITKGIRLSSYVKYGIGDDCAVLKTRKGVFDLMTSDMIIEDVHFVLKHSTPEAIGNKSIAVNISDIASCGGTAKDALVSIGVPTRLSADYILRIYNGIKKICKKFNINIIGGDTNKSDKLIISVAMRGEVKSKNLVLRNGAKNNDIVFITGYLKEKPDHMCFTPRVKESRYLIENFKINSMIDISDGLIQDLSHIISSSNMKGALLYESLMKNQKSDIENIMNTGEQFELLFTVSAFTSEKILKAKTKMKFHPIGEITDNKGIFYVNKYGNKKILQAKGYRHF